MDTLIKEYRTKHKKCKWCKYENFIGPKCFTPGASYQKCVLKDKKITNDYRAVFCKCYCLKEDE